MDKPNNWSMGTFGRLAQWSNLTAVAILSTLAVWLVLTNLSEHREDRTMFRDELKAERKQATEAATELRGALDRNTDASRTVAEELRTLRRQMGKGSGYDEPELIPFLPRTVPRPKG